MSFEPDQMDITNTYIKRRLLGDTADHLLENVVAEKIQTLGERITQLSQNLLSRQVEVEQILTELVVEAKQLEAFGPSTTQTEKLVQIIQELSQVRQTLRNTLDKEKTRLDEQKTYLLSLDRLLESTQALVKQRSETQGFPHQETFLLLGGKLSTYISNKTS